MGDVNHAPMMPINIFPLLLIAELLCKNINDANPVIADINATRTLCLDITQLPTSPPFSPSSWDCHGG